MLVYQRVYNWVVYETVFTNLKNVPLHDVKNIVNYPVYNLYAQSPFCLPRWSNAENKIHSMLGQQLVLV